MLNRTMAISTAIRQDALLGRVESTLSRAMCLLLLSFTLPSNAAAYEETAVTNGGTISGFVRIQGAIPKLPPLEITKSKDVCRNVPNETLVVGPNSGVRYSVVTLEGIAKGEAIDREASHELDNAGCRFIPHVQVMAANQFLTLKNTDPILHTAHALFSGRQPEFNVGLYPGKVTRKPLVAPGLVKVICEVHPWMSAYIVVTDSPYDAVTDVYGEYQMPNVPPGSYRLKVWHERLGTQEKKVEVKRAGTSKVDFMFSPSQGGNR